MRKKGIDVHINCFEFDRVEEKNVNGTFVICAINEQDEQEYLLSVDKVIIEFSESYLEGRKLVMTCDLNRYAYRGKFNSAEEMKAFANNLSTLIKIADKKNSAC